MASRKQLPSLTQLGAPMRTASDYEACAARLKALADPDRLRIVNGLLQGACTVSALADALGVAIDRVSHHLSVLRAARLVNTKRQGRFVVYSLPPDIVAVAGDGGIKSINLGCCQLDLAQPHDDPREPARKNGRKNLKPAGR